MIITFANGTRKELPPCDGGARIQTRQIQDGWVVSYWWRNLCDQRTKIFFRLFLCITKDARQP